MQRDSKGHASALPTTTALPPRAANDQTADPPPRAWAVRIIRNRAMLLGYVDAPDKQAAEAAAVKEFGLTEEQRKRLIIDEYR